MRQGRVLSRGETMRCGALPSWTLPDATENCRALVRHLLYKEEGLARGRAGAAAHARDAASRVGAG